jgi:hypothetical protein
MGVVLGCLALLMVQHLSGGVWGIDPAPAVRSGGAHAAVHGGACSCRSRRHALDLRVVDARSANDPIIQRRRLSQRRPSSWRARCSTFWSGHDRPAAHAWSAEHDRTGDPALLDKMSRLSGAGLLIYGLTVTFAMVDWTMSVNRIGSRRSGACFTRRPGPVGVCLRHHRAVDAGADGALNKRPDHAPLPRPRQAAVRVPDAVGVPVVLAVPDHLVGEPAREIPHYLDRWDNSWRYLSVFIVVGHFMLAVRAAAVARSEAQHEQAAVHRDLDPVRALADYYWHIAPEFHHEGFNFSLLDIALPLALGGIFHFAVRVAARRPLAAAGQRPALEKALHHHVH